MVPCILRNNLLHILVLQALVGNLSFHKHGLLRNCLSRHYTVEHLFVEVDGILGNLLQVQVASPLHLQ